MSKAIPIALILLVVTVIIEFSAGDVVHITSCNPGEPCIACNATGEPAASGFKEATISYRNIVVNEFNTYRSSYATKNNIANMKYTVWIDEYQSLMKKMTVDVGQGPVSCYEQLLPDGGLHFTIVDSIVPGQQAVANDAELKSRANILVGMIIDTRPTLVHQYDVSRFGCYYAVKSDTANKMPLFFLRCLFYTDIAFNVKQINGTACSRCGIDDHCSTNYKGLCVDKNHVENSPDGSRGASSRKESKFFIINAILIVGLLFKLF